MMKKMRKLLSIVAVGAMVMAMLGGCSSKAEGTAISDGGEKTEGGKKKIALFMTHMSNAFTMELSDAVKTQAEELGYELIINDASQDAAKQTNQIETAVTQGIDGIIIEPVSVDGIVSAVKSAKEAGVPVVIVNQQISEPSAADCYVGANAADSGEILMTQAMKDLDGKGNIATLLGPMGSDGQVGRSEGFKRVLDQNPDATVVFENTADWDTDKALKLSENWLQAGKDIKAIVAQNDNMAAGASKAIADAKLEGQILVYGIDATPEGLQAVKDGKLAATVSQGTTQQGIEAAKACVTLIEGGTVEAENIISCELITIDNVDQYLK